MKIGMAIGMAISASILVIICIVLFMNLSAGSADRSTGTITEELLAEQTMPAGLPDFDLGSTDTEVDANALFAAGLEANRLSGAGYDLEKYVQQTQPAIDSLIAAAAGSLKPGFVDERTPAKRFESPEVVNALSGLNKAVKDHITLLNEEGNYNDARVIASAYLMFGRQMFEKNLRLKARQRGLLIMRNALSQYGGIVYLATRERVFTQDQYKTMAADMKAWLDAIQKIENTWNAKLNAIETIDQKNDLPNIADIIYVAKNDKDRSFRVFAARRLGYALYERGDPGNQEAINAAIDELEKSDDKLIAEAAKAGRSIKDQNEYHELRK